MTKHNFANTVIDRLTITEQRRYLANGCRVSVALRISQNFKDVAQDQVVLKTWVLVLMRVTA